MFSLAGKVAVITGSSRGIGRATDAAGFVTGQTLVADGGATLNDPFSQTES